MPNPRLGSLAAIVLTMACGCGPTRFDASSEERVAASMEAMMTPMTEAEREAFARDVQTICQREFDQAISPDTMSVVTTSTAHMHKAVDGMTVAEIRARAAEIRKRKPAKRAN